LVAREAEEGRGRTTGSGLSSRMESLGAFAELVVGTMLTGKFWGTCIEVGQRGRIERRDDERKKGRKGEKDLGALPGLDRARVFL